MTHTLGDKATRSSAFKPKHASHCLQRENWGLNWGMARERRGGGGCSGGVPAQCSQAGWAERVIVMTLIILVLMLLMIMLMICTILMILH